MSNFHIGKNTGQNHAAATTMEVSHGYDPQTVSSLADKNVLVLGSGINRWEDYYISDFAGSANVINIDPIYSDWNTHKEYTKYSEHLVGKLVCSVGQSLPIKSQSIDAVFSTWSMPLVFIEDIDCPERMEDQVCALANELARVVRLGGIISMEPINQPFSSVEDTQNQANLVLRHFRDVGFDCQAPQILSKHNGHMYWNVGLRGVKS